MAITATSRVCASCQALLPEPPAAQVCPRCSRVAVPLHTEWPNGMKRWLLGQLVASFWAPWRSATQQYRWEQLLRAAIAGKQWRQQVIPHAAALMDCYTVACDEVTAWETAGSPQLY